MKFNQKICIITDLDGTLLPASKVPLERDVKAIRKFEQAGGVFSIATGRTVQASLRYAEQLQLKSPMIVFNGAMIYHPVTGEKLLLKALPEEGVVIHNMGLHFSTEPLATFVADAKRAEDKSVTNRGIVYAVTGKCN